MTRPLLTIVLSAIMLGATTDRAFGSEPGDRMAAAPSVLAVEASATLEAGESAPGGDRTAADPQPVPFDHLWVGIVSVVVLLLVVRMLRLDTAWRKQPAIRPKTWNESRSRDVLTDE